MSDPLTIGTVVSLALSLASEAALKGAVEEGVKDAYKALKHKIAYWASVDVEALEKNPSSLGRRTVIAETVDKLPDGEKSSVKILADSLVKELEHNVAQGLVGIDVGELVAARIKLDGITVHEGTGIIVQKMVAKEDFELKNLTVGESSVKKAMQ